MSRSPIATLVLLAPLSIATSARAQDTLLAAMDTAQVAPRNASSLTPTRKSSSSSAVPHADATATEDAAAVEPPAETPPTPPASGPLDAFADALSHLQFLGFVDVYLAQHWTLPNGFSGEHATEIPQRAYDVMGGPALSFVGADLRYVPQPFGATLSIRFGSSVPRLMGPTSGLPDGLQFLKQAYVSWAPLSNLQVDFGLFDTPYGAEVAESWLNATYTRGALYNVVQPFYHTGFRAVWSPVEHLSVTALAVNGWNSFIDNNDGKTFGAQAAYSDDTFNASIGYLGGPETQDDSRWRHFVDAIFKVKAGDTELTLNGDLIVEDVGMGAYDTSWGAMVTLRERLSPEWALAERAEYLGDPDTGAGLGTGTFTIDWNASSNVVVRLDTRVDAATDTRFVSQNRQPASYVASSVLGVVVHTN